MAAESKKEIELEIAHVLFLDIVGYSKLSVNEQHGRVDELNGIVRASEQFQKAEGANRILKIPTGDGMALVFYKSPEEPAQCAFEISRALKDNAHLQVRMGIHSGPASGVVDMNERTNVAGAGINLAQRVMDCGDAGHILLSNHVAEDLAEYERWRPFLHDIGAFEVKHGVRVSVTNLYSDEIGNPKLPTKLQAVKKHRAHVRWAEVAIGLLVLGAIVAAFMIVSSKPTTSLTAIPEKSIAVLPFVNMSEDKANEYFSDGISEELLNLLAKIPQLQVTARTSSFSFKGKEVAIPEIARTLHVAHVLEGSVRKAGNSVRITAQLIKAGTDTHLWSQTYDRKMDDIFAIQDEIAADVVKQLKVTLLGAAPKARATDPEAYALYLQAVQLGRPFTAEAFQQSDALYRKVLAIDPRYAPAWYGLARNFGNETGQGLLPGKEGFAQAREAAVRALAIDPDYGPAHAQLGWIAMYGDNDLAGAALHVERALALEPADLSVLSTSATLLQSLGRLDEALALEEAAVRRDPVNVTTLFNLGYHQRMAGRLDAAIASFRTVLIAKYEKDAPSNIGSVYAYRGEADKAFEWLDKAVEYGDGGLGEIVTDNLFDKIHADPRWPAFLRKIGKAPEQLAKIEFKVTLPQ